jgi:hypothetical protein
MLGRGAVAQSNFVAVRFWRGFLQLHRLKNYRFHSLMRTVGPRIVLVALATWLLQLIVSYAFYSFPWTLRILRIYQSPYAVRLTRSSFCARSPSLSMGTGQGNQVSRRYPTLLWRSTDFSDHLCREQKATIYTLFDFFRQSPVRYTFRLDLVGRVVLGDIGKVRYMATQQVNDRIPADILNRAAAYYLFLVSGLVPFMTFAFRSCS